MDAKTIVSAVAGIGYCFGFLPYFVEIKLGNTKPVFVTWLIFFVLDVIFLIGEFQKGTVTGQIVGATVLAGITTVLALLCGDRRRWTRTERMCMVGAAVGFASLFFLHNPVAAIVISSVVTFLAGIPTIESAWNKPQDESLLGWTIFAAFSFVALGGVQSWTLEGAAQTITFLIVDIVVLLVVKFRR